MINTHFHGDHCEGITKFNEDGQVIPTFPNAQHVVHRQEYEDASNPNERTRATYIDMNFQPLMEHGQLRLLEGDTEIVSGVHAVVTRGHTSGHMSVRVSQGNEHLLFTCDMATYAVQFEKLAWMTAYDVEPLITLETKRVWQQWALETNAVLIFPHDVTMLAARATLSENGKFKLIPLSEDDGACYA